jgi:hypothetical protein
MYTPKDEQARYNDGIDLYEELVDASQTLKHPPNDSSSTKFSCAKMIAAARRLGPVLLGADPIPTLSELSRRSGVAAPLAACALGNPSLPSGIPGPVTSGLIETQVARLYYDVNVPVYPEAIVVVRPTTPVRRVQTRRSPIFGLERTRQSFYTPFAQGLHGTDNTKDYAAAIGALLSPTRYDETHPPTDRTLALAVSARADYVAKHCGFVATRIDAIRHELAIDPAWLISENRTQLEHAAKHSKTSDRSETLARQPGFGRAFREALGPERIILIHVCDEHSAGSGLHHPLRYHAPSSARRLNGEELERALSDPEDPMYPHVQDAVWAWGPDLKDGVATMVMGGELIDSRTDERFVLVIISGGRRRPVNLAIPYVAGKRPELTELDLLRIALAARAWEGDSPFTGLARRRSTQYAEWINIPARDPHTRVASFMAGAAGSARDTF